ncbi:PTS sugar transporter subunit IIB [Clostridium estertheticum]|uniref:PTS sugar transporter subunit IIB n=1 Tax=Clostridium estertheticum TaxID=238834 RepID=UPI001C6EEFEF|nr:PTS sugar transporter subunit IIB [Clostridium estertheticum]MBW9151574.1 PTS sugar transporter subunit IIB [Clostridium estertheticum]WLC83297.1 PTS sugar transporter subunit IIB [Clostridium estertheticum]
MEINFVRIDDRLIHGQVASIWVKETKCNKIFVCSDEVAEDKLRKTLLLKVAPPGVKAYVLPIDKVLEVYKNPKYDSFKALILCVKPGDVLRLIEGGMVMKSVNLGGMCFKTGRTQISGAVSLGPEDIDALNKIHELGIELELRKIASDSKIDVMSKIKDL